MKWIALAAFLFWVFLSGCNRQNAAPITTAGGGTDVGSASDYLPEEHLAAWFVGDQKPIVACIKIGPDFGLSLAEATSTITKAFQIWKNYIEQHHIYLDRPADQRLTTRFSIEPECHAETDLIFYLGVENDETARAKSVHLNPTAFIQPTFFDKGIPRGQGFIWVAKQGGIRTSPALPDWHKDGRFLAEVLHQLGHAYGNDHVPGTVMAANLSEYLDSAWSGEKLTQIDYCRELAPCFGCKYVAQAKLASLPNRMALFIKYASENRVSDDLVAVVKRNAEGEFYRFELNEKGSIAIPAWFPVKTALSKGENSSGAKTFKVVSNSGVSNFTDQSYIKYSVLTQATMFPRLLGVVVVEYNMATCEPNRSNGRQPLHLSFEIKGEHIPFLPFPLVPVF